MPINMAAKKKAKWNIFKLGNNTFQFKLGNNTKFLVNF